MPSDARPAILWFRNDLRLADHAALAAAAADGRRVLPVYILDDAAAGPWRLGGAARWWLHGSLTALARDLRAKGAHPVFRRGASIEEIPRLARDIGAGAVYTGGSAEPWARRLDRDVADELAKTGVALHLMRTGTLFPPDSIRAKTGGPYSVYTPFARACLERGAPPPPLPAPARIASPPPPRSDDPSDWGLTPTRPDWASGLRALWTPGERGAEDRLRHFLAHGLARYAVDRDRPDLDGGSMLSPHLRFGEISPARVWHALPAGTGPDAFRRELLWREFCADLLWHRPDMAEQPLRPEFAAMPWRRSPADLDAWRQGRTGIPIVDAGMRQLWRTGWMHNRVRMIAASYLVKHLLLPWQAGEAWFWDTLVDADLASNAGGWQWVAGCGADAAPYFRIFNPVLQGRKFDPDGAYVRRFVPELAHLDARAIHAPWEAPWEFSGRIDGYPAPAIDPAEGRARALAALEVVKTHRADGRTMAD